jgi:hypothetical protein
LRQVEENINSGKRSGFIIYNPEGYSQREINIIRLQANRALQMISNDVEPSANFNNQYKYAIWRVDSEGGITIYIEA